MNSVVLLGRVVRDAELRGTKTQMAVFTLAVPRRYKKDEVDFIDCIVFGKTAEFAEKYVHKGTPFVVHGAMQTGSYKDKEGRTVKTVTVACDQIEFASSSRKEHTDSEKAPTSEDNGPAPAPTGDDFMQIPDSMGEELPFIG